MGLSDMVEIITTAFAVKASDVDVAKVSGKDETIKNALLAMPIVKDERDKDNNFLFSGFVPTQTGSDLKGTSRRISTAAEEAKLSIVKMAAANKSGWYVRVKGKITPTSTSLPAMMPVQPQNATEGQQEASQTEEVPESAEQPQGEAEAPAQTHTSEIAQAS